MAKEKSFFLRAIEAIEFLFAATLKGIIRFLDWLTPNTSTTKNRASSTVETPSKSTSSPAPKTTAATTTSTSSTPSETPSKEVERERLSAEIKELEKADPTSDELFWARVEWYGLDSPGASRQAKLKNKREAQLKVLEATLKEVTTREQIGKISTDHPLYKAQSALESIKGSKAFTIPEVLAECIELEKQIQEVRAYQQERMRLGSP